MVHTRMPSRQENKILNRTDPFGHEACGTSIQAKPSLELLNILVSPLFQLKPCPSYGVATNQAQWESIHVWKFCSQTGRTGMEVVARIIANSLFASKNMVVTLRTRSLSRLLRWIYHFKVILRLPYVRIVVRCTENYNFQNVRCTFKIAKPSRTSIVRKLNLGTGTLGVI